MAKQRWKAVKMKQKFDRQRFQNFSGSYSDQDLFISKGGSEKEIYVPEEGADTGLFASVLQVRDKYYPSSTKKHIYLPIHTTTLKLFCKAYKNHWVLRTKPDDWFFPVIRRIAQVVDDNALHPEVMAYLGRGRPKSELRVNFNRGFDKMFEELSLQISKNLVTSEYAKVGKRNFYKEMLQ